MDNYRKRVRNVRRMLEAVDCAENPRENLKQQNPTGSCNFDIVDPFDEYEMMSLGTQLLQDMNWRKDEEMGLASSRRSYGQSSATTINYNPCSARHGLACSQDFNAFTRKPDQTPITRLKSEGHKRTPRQKRKGHWDSGPKRDFPFYNGRAQWIEEEEQNTSQYYMQRDYLSEKHPTTFQWLALKPKEMDTIVMILDGEHKLELATILQYDFAKYEVVVQLIDSKKVVILRCDEVCMYSQ